MTELIESDQCCYLDLKLWILHAHKQIDRTHGWIKRNWS